MVSQPSENGSCAFQAVGGVTRHAAEVWGMLMPVRCPLSRARSNRMALDALRITPDSSVVVCGVSHAQQVVGPSNPGNLPPVTGVERHLPRAHSGSRRLARHPAAEEVATTGEDESNTLSSSSTVRASPCGRLSNHPALLEPLSEPLLAPITPLLAVGGCGRRPPPVPRVTDLIVSCTPQTAERWRRCRRTWAVAASSSRACGGVAVAARSPSARHAYAVRRRLGPAGGGYQTAAAPPDGAAHASGGCAAALATGLPASGRVSGRTVSYVVCVTDLLRLVTVARGAADPRSIAS